MNKKHSKVIVFEHWNLAVRNKIPTDRLLSVSTTKGNLGDQS